MNGGLRFSYLLIFMLAWVRRSYGHVSLTPSSSGGRCNQALSKHIKYGEAKCPRVPYVIKTNAGLPQIFRQPLAYTLRGFQSAGTSKPTRIWG